MRLLLSTLLIIFMTFPALADEYVYSPEGCDFEITFPEEPGTMRRCHDKLPDQCDMMHGYTKVFGLDATVNIYVHCEPGDENLRDSFSPDTMRTALLARPGVDRLEVYDISHDNGDLAETAAIIGAGKTPNGNDVVIYVGQLWVGDNSMFTMEGELIGSDVEDADFLFADIMRSLRHKDAPPFDPQPKTTENNAESTSENESKEAEKDSANTPEKP